MFKKFKDTAKNRLKKSGNKCLEVGDGGFADMKTFIDSKFGFTAAEYDENMKTCKNNDGYGTGGDTVNKKCTFWHKVLEPVKFFYNECFHDNGREILSTDDCKPKRAIRRDRVLVAQTPKKSVSLVLDEGMKQFDKKFRSIKKYSTIPKYGMDSEKLFRKLRQLVKAKLIQKKLNSEGKQIRTIGIYSTVDYEVVDYLEDGANDESLTGFTPIGITRATVADRDVKKMIAQVDKNDIDDGQEMPLVRELQRGSKAWVAGVGWVVVLALFFG
jgi:hypothetical protein